MSIPVAILAIIPGILICVLIFYLDKHDRENYVNLLISFFVGVVAALPALLIQFWLDEAGFDPSENLGLLLVNVFIVVALSEELVKLAGLLGIPYWQDFFNEPLDGIVYAVMIGMGFATLENLIYAYTFGIETTVVRAFTAVPAHGVFAIIMGYFVGLSKFRPDKKWQLILAGLGIAVGVHGLYDFFILQHYYDWLMLMGAVMIVICSYFCWKLIKEHQEQSPFRKKEEKSHDLQDNKEMKDEFPSSTNEEDSVV